MIHKNTKTNWNKNLPVAQMFRGNEKKGRKASWSWNSKRGSYHVKPKEKKRRMLRKEVPSSQGALVIVWALVHPLYIGGCDLSHLLPPLLFLWERGDYMSQAYTHTFQWMEQLCYTWPYGHVCREHAEASAESRGSSPRQCQGKT